jgi:hypothetical protein
MKIYDDLIQGTPAWHKVRAGIPTASAFMKILTAKTMKLSTQSDGYENRLIAERLTGNPIDDFGGTRWMDRGKDLEADAVAFYEMNTGLECRYVGFIANDAGTFGASPDMLVYKDGILIKGLELKCPAPGTHVGYVLNETGAYEDYKPQVQGNMLASGLPEWDIMSYHPEMKPSIYTAKTDIDYQCALAAALTKVEKNIQAKIAKIKGEK